MKFYKLKKIEWKDNRHNIISFNKHIKKKNKDNLNLLISSGYIYNDHMLDIYYNYNNVSNCFEIYLNKFNKIARIWDREIKDLKLIKKESIDLIDRLFEKYYEVNESNIFAVTKKYTIFNI